MSHEPAQPDVSAGRLATTTAPVRGERFVELARVANVVIEEIVSSDQPGGNEDRQAHHEWVALLEGAATLEVRGELVELSSGSWMLLPAGTPHRVVRTTMGARWLAVHVHPVD